MVSSLTLRYLTHFKFVFVYSVRECSNFILLHTAVLVFPAPLIEETFFFFGIFLLILLCWVFAVARRIFSCRMLGLVP